MLMLILLWIFRTVGFLACTMIVVLLSETDSFAQNPSFLSPDGRCEAKLVRTGFSEWHYHIRENGTTIFITHAKYRGNDVKDGRFSPDSNRFAAAYHYGRTSSYPEGYTWIRIWDIRTRATLRTKEFPGWILIPESIFD